MAAAASKGGRVIVIGAGLAGLAAAYLAAQGGARVLVLHRSAPGMGTNSGMANAYFTAPNEGYSPEEFTRDTLAIGRDLGRPQTVAHIAAQAAPAFAALEPLGLRCRRVGPSGLVFATERADAIRGAGMMRAVLAGVRATPGVELRGGFYVRRILVEGGRAVGVEGWDKDGRCRRLLAGAVVLAGGGAGAVWQRSDNSRGILGQAYRLAAQAGLTLRDMEMVQFFPLVLDQPGLPCHMLYPPYPRQARLLGPGGEDLLARAGGVELDVAIQTMRDKLSLIIHQAGQEGPVTLDYTQVPGPWDAYPLAFQKKLKHDFAASPVRIAPAVHFCMGGVAADPAGNTALPGLLACGEVLWGLHGANRRGGNALTECVVTGWLAGGEAARQAAAAGEPRRDMAADQAGEGPDLDAGASGPTAPWREALAGVRRIAWERCGLVRDAAGLDKGLAELAALRGQAAGLEPRDLRQGLMGEDLQAACLSLGAALAASRARQESRGAFQRGDHPDPAAQAMTTLINWDGRGEPPAAGLEPVEPPA